MTAQTTITHVPAARNRRFKVGNKVLIPLWIDEPSSGEPHGWCGVLLVGTVKRAEEEFDMAPGADPTSWWELTVEAIPPGETEPHQYDRSNSTAIPLPV